MSNNEEWIEEIYQDTLEKLSEKRLFFMKQLTRQKIRNNKENQDIVKEILRDINWKIRLFRGEKQEEEKEFVQDIKETLF